VHARIARTDGVGEARILGIKRLLDLLELTLLVLRKRHVASHKNSRSATGSMTFT
jgi:hypothetical protein